jgi:hypothetical protein
MDQAFTYSQYVSSTAPRVFVPLSGMTNNGEGPGQVCLSDEQGMLSTDSCDPANPAPQEVFTVVPTPTPTPEPA